MLCKRRQCAASIHQWLAVMHILCLPYTNFVCILNRKTVAIQWNRKLKLSTLRFWSTTIPIYTEMHNPLPFHTENRKFKTSTVRKESNVVSKIRIFIDLLQRGGNPFFISTKIVGHPIWGMYVHIKKILSFMQLFDFLSNWQQIDGITNLCYTLTLYPFRLHRSVGTFSSGYPWY